MGEPGTERAQEWVNPEMGEPRNGAVSLYAQPSAHEWVLSFSRGHGLAVPSGTCARSHVRNTS